MKNRGSTPILTNLVGAHSRNIPTKFEANPYSGSREEDEQEAQWACIAHLVFRTLLIKF